MKNNINVNIDNNASSCHIHLFNKELNKNVSFSVLNTNLLTKDFIEEELIKAYSFDDKAIIEAITYTNRLFLSVEADNMSLISEEVNRMAVYADGEPVSLITAIKVIDEEGNELRSSIQAKEDGVELIVEEEVDKATVTLEFSSYLDFKSENAIFLRSFGELEYWYDISNREIYTVDAEKNKKLYIKLTASHISSSSYAYAVPSMISETVFFSNYKKCFFKIDGSTVTKIKDETNFFMLMHLYDDVYITSFKNSNAYDFTLVEFTNIEAATYEVLDTHSIKLSKSASEYCYSPLKSYDYDNKLHIYFYSYQHNSYIPSTDQYICARIDKEAKRFDFTGIEPLTLLIYEDEEYELVFKWADRKYYLNGKALVGTSYSYPSKPFTLINDGIMYCYSITYNAGTIDLVSIDLVNAKILKTLSVLDKMWSNGCYAGRKSIDVKSVSDSWDMFKDCDLNKRRVRSTTKDDFILTTETTSSSYVTITDLSPLYIKKEVVQNKKFLIGYGYAYFQSLQRGNVISAGITVTENTDVEIKPFSSFNFYFDNNFIIEEEKDYNLFTSITDVKRLVCNNKFNLSIDEAATILNESNNKYDLAFAHWDEYTETFEDDSPKLIKWTNSTYTEEGLTRSNIRAYEGSYSGYMGRDTKGGSNVPDYYSEFETIGEKIEFSYYNSFTQYNQYLKVYVDNVEKFSDQHNSTAWETASINLAPNKKHTIRIFFEDSTVEPSNDKGFFIDNLTANAPVPDKNATIYFNSFDLGMYSAPQGFNVMFDGLETSSNVTKSMYYSIDNGATWLEFNNLLPNVDGITLKAVFTKHNIEDEAYVRFNSVVVMPGEIEVTSYADTERIVRPKRFDVVTQQDLVRKVTKDIDSSSDTDRKVEKLYPLPNPYTFSSNTQFSEGTCPVYLGAPFGEHLWTKNNGGLYIDAVKEDGTSYRIYNISGQNISTGYVNCPSMIFNDVIRNNGNLFKLLKDGTYERITSSALTEYRRVDRIDDSLWIGYYLEEGIVYYDLLSITEDIEVTVLDTHSFSTNITTGASSMSALKNAYTPMIMQRYEDKILLNLTQQNTTYNKAADIYVNTVTKKFEEIQKTYQDTLTKTLLYKDEEFEVIKDITNSVINIIKNGSVEPVSISSTTLLANSVKVLSRDGDNFMFVSANTEQLVSLTAYIAILTDDGYKIASIDLGYRLVYQPNGIIVQMNTSNKTNFFYQEDLNLVKLELEDIELVGSYTIANNRLTISNGAEIVIKPGKTRTYRAIYSYGSYIESSGHRFEPHNGNVPYKTRIMSGRSQAFDLDALYILDEKRYSEAPQGTDVIVYADVVRNVTKVATTSNDSCRKVSKNYISIIDTKSQVIKDIIALPDTMRKVITVGEVELTTDTVRQVVRTYSANVNTLREVIKTISVYTLTNRKVIKNLYGDSESVRRICDNKKFKVLSVREIFIKHIWKLDSRRIIRRCIQVKKRVDTKRLLYEVGAIYVPELKANFELSKGKLILTNQKF